MELLRSSRLAASVAINMALLTEGESPNCRAYAELTRLKAASPTFNYTQLGSPDIADLMRAVMDAHNLHVIKETEDRHLPGVSSMTAITILPEKLGTVETRYRALAGERESVGRSVGEALDALTLQLRDDETGMLVVIQNLRPDAFFTAAQHQRLEELMSRWRTARDNGRSLGEEEQAELQSLIDDELNAARLRAEATVREVAR